MIQKIRETNMKATVQPLPSLLVVVEVAIPIKQATGILLGSSESSLTIPDGWLD
jgi:hypothetical protein